MCGHVHIQITGSNTHMHEKSAYTPLPNVNYQYKKKWP